jgi:hypothetical protein
MRGELHDRGLCDLDDDDRCCSKVRLLVNARVFIFSHVVFTVAGKVTRSSSEDLSSSSNSLAECGPCLLPDAFRGRASTQPDKSPFENMLFPTAV